MDSSHDVEWPGTRSGSSGPLICLLHGFLGCKDDWSGITAGLSADNRCIAYDLPGHGSNLAPHGINEMSSAIKELDVQRHLTFREPWHLVGYSMGGRFALHYALMFPQSVLSLTLISASPGIEDESVREKRRKDDAAWAVKIQMLPPSLFLDEWYRQNVFASLESNRELKEKIISSRLNYRPRQMAQIVQNWGQGNVPSMWHRITELMCPVQIIAGHDDETYLHHVARMRNLSPGAQVVMVEHAGHTVHLEQPGEIVKCIRNFTGKS